MDRINTCVSLFLEYNKIEKFIEEYRKFNVKLNSLNSLDKKKYYINELKEYFSEDEKQTRWYKMIEEKKQIKKFLNDKNIKMIISLCALIIGLNKEKIINKNTNDFDVLVKQNNFENAISKLADNKNGKLYIGNIKFDNESKCLQFVRNKLLHGDYYIKNQYIVLKNNGKIGKIHYENLFYHCISLTNLIKCHDKCIEQNMILYQKNDNNRITNKIFIEEIYDVKLNFKVRGKREISFNIIILISNIKDSIYENNINKKLPITKAIELALKEHESEICSNHININFEILSFGDKSNDYIENKINKMHDFFEKNYNIDNPTFEDMFQYLNLNNFSDSREYFNDNFLSLAIFLKTSMKRNWYSKLNITDQEVIRYRNVSSALDILKFYCYFNYGLDDILFSNKEISLKSIFSGEYFDYSKLDLSLFDDPNMKYNVTFGSYAEQLNGIVNEYEKSKEAYLTKKVNYDKFIEKHGRSKPEVEKKIKAPLDYLEKCYNTNKKNYDISKEFNVNKYIRNLNIIYHIRNSIDHGNYKIDDSDIENIRYVFKDIYDGNVNYYLNISVENFRKLFNCKDLMSAFYEKIAGKYTFEELYDKEIYYDCMYVRSEKRNEWNAYVEEVLTNGDESDKKILSLTHEALENINNPIGNYNNINDFNDCLKANINNYLGLAMYSMDFLQHGVTFDDTKYSVEEYEKMLKNIFIYDSLLYRYLSERRIEDGNENSLLRKVLNDLKYKGLLPNYSRGKR